MRMVQELLGYCFIGLVGVACLAVLYAPVYFLLRKKVAFKRQVLYVLMIGSVLVILSVTVLESAAGRVIRGEELIAEERFFNLLPFYSFTEVWRMSREKKITQMIANILMFVPPGFLFPAVFARARCFHKTVGNMFLFSAIIEFAQYWIGRSADVDDIILNTLGGAAGYFVFRIAYKLLGKWKLRKL